MVLLRSLLLVLFISPAALAQSPPSYWASEWPETDFTKTSVDLSEIQSGGPPKDGIPSIDDPRFLPADQIEGLAGSEPVIGLSVEGVARAYPLRILIWHEIVNDVIAGVPVAVTYCPLCNAAIVFDRRVEGEVLEFGTTGKLRRSDLVMYDRQSESWWQQFLGEAIVGARTGQRLAVLPARLESFSAFKEREGNAEVLVPTNENLRPYGSNPYSGYDSSSFPFLYQGDLPDGIAPLAYVVAVGDEAWPLSRLQEAGRLEESGLVLEWKSGMNSALDSSEISEGRDIGQVVVTRQGALVPHDVTFAFVFHAFRPEGTIKF